MRKLVALGALLLAACSSPTEDQGQAQPLPTVATATTAATTMTEAATTIRPATTRPIKLVVGRYCAAMRAAGWSFEKARAYYDDHGRPAHMDADGDGIPCETVYGEVGGPGPAPGSLEDCDPAYPDECLPSPPPDLDCAGIGHRFRLTTATATHTAWTVMATGMGASGTASEVSAIVLPELSAPGRTSVNQSG